MKKVTFLLCTLSLILAVTLLGCSGTPNVQLTNPSGEGPQTVALRTSANFVILSKSGVSTVPTSAITGDIGTSPIDSTGLTGFDLTADGTNVFSTSAQVTGNLYASDYAVPTPSNLTTAISDMQLAYDDAAGRLAPDFTELGSGEIGGMTLAPGLYKWSTGVSISTDVTLSGGANDVWIFQIGGGLTVAAAKSVILAGGALPKNIFWQSAGVVSLGTTSHFEGIILSQSSITMDTGASINGRLLAQTLVALDANTVTQPAL
ncbi:ice-binding family protein [uncultured Sphaerochaeta sp.]|uniref:ice-binding family protein n=1 Tax=uncultured Sphaerochaeta sp. TaxID=886478 RepID=UPI002A0A4057|nr:ice-binding family protein [uncultured Sphaerochaeta sp.]